MIFKSVNRFFAISIYDFLITLFFCPVLNPEHLGRKPKVPFWRVIKAIIYRLKTGCQWRELPVSVFCDKVLISWQTVYYYFNKWSKQGLWQKVWHQILSDNKTRLD